MSYNLKPPSKPRKIITYGTFDLLHYGHIRLLERAKALGDYLIVGVTSDSFDKQRGKLNVVWNLEKRLNALRQTGLADEILVEEYFGQKVDDILRLRPDVFVVGSDWRGHFDYLKDFCDVQYLERTKDISSTHLRNTYLACCAAFCSNRILFLGSILVRFIAHMRCMTYAMTLA